MATKSRYWYLDGFEVAFSEVLRRLSVGCTDFDNTERNLDCSGNGLECTYVLLRMQCAYGEEEKRMKLFDVSDLPVGSVRLLGICRAR